LVQATEALRFAEAGVDAVVKDGKAVLKAIPKV
jgi:hypothetical protein